MLSVTLLSVITLSYSILSSIPFNFFNLAVPIITAITTIVAITTFQLLLEYDPLAKMLHSYPSISNSNVTTVENKNIGYGQTKI